MKSMPFSVSPENSSVVSHRVSSRPRQWSAPAALYALLCCCLLFAFATPAYPQSTVAGDWTWISGSSTYNQPGVYGTLGTFAAANVPGYCSSASSWTDSSGHLWLFCSDLWEFNPSTSEWAWMGGSNTGSQSGVYGTLGTPAAANIPGSRYSASSWTDSSGHFWLFGGIGYDSTGTSGDLNDLWEFNPSTNEWAWMGGNSTLTCPSSGSCGQPGVYGTLGTPAAGNVPVGRYGAASWTDSSGHLWLFGGEGVNTSGQAGPLNDLWEFNISSNEWAWMGGSSLFSCVTVVASSGPPMSETNCGQPGVYGTLGTPAAGNIPGSRSYASSWTDSSGHLWLFGGIGYDANVSGDNNLVFLNDLWEFNPSTNEWAWMGGSPPSTNCGTTDNFGYSQTYCASPSGVYGVLGTPAAGNIPGGREEASSWIDSSGNLWLFGGFGIDSVGNGGNYANPWNALLNDLWKFNPSTGEWAWMGGSTTATGCVTSPESTTYCTGQPGVYGTLGTPAASNEPGSRYSAANWIGASGNFWLFGGTGPAGDLNDLWEYQPPAAGTPTPTPTKTPTPTPTPTCAAVPPAPSGLTTSSNQNGSILTLSWTADTAPANCTISSYNIYRSTTSGFTPSSSNLLASGVTATSYSTTGFGVYYFVVEAVDAYGTSAPSAQIEGVISDATATPTPTPTPSPTPTKTPTTTPSPTPTPTPFTITVSPTSLTIPQCGSGTVSLTETGYSGNVTYTLSGLPSGVTATLDAVPTPLGGAVYTIAASCSAAVGSTKVTISGNTGAKTATATLALTVSAKPPSFTVSASPASLTIPRGGSGTSTISVTGVTAGEFAGGVTFEAGNLPSGVTAAFTPTSTTESSVLTLTAGSKATIGTATITISAIGNLSSTLCELLGSTTITLTVAKPTPTPTPTPTNTPVPNSGPTATPKPTPTPTPTITPITGPTATPTKTPTPTPTKTPSFTVSASPAALSIVQRSSGTDTITVTNLNGFTGSVTLAASNLPTGVTAAFATNPTTSSSVLTLAVTALPAGLAAPGTYTVTITGTSGALTASTNIALTITPAPFTLSVSPTSLTVPQCGSGIVVLTDEALTNGNSINFTTSGVPSGVTIAVDPVPLPFDADYEWLLVTVGCSAPVGTSTVTFTATSGTQTKTATLELTVSAAS
jgi:N-acetylneuraminic acid mutarotase